MKSRTGIGPAPVVIALAIALGVAACVVAQDASSTSQSSSKQGSATASASSSGRASASSSTQGYQKGGGQAGAPTAVDPRNIYAAWYTDNRRARPVQADDPALAAHLKYAKVLGLDGSVIADGPFRDGTGLLMVFRAASDQAAAEIVQRDPSVAERTYSVALKNWRVAQGTLVGGGAIGGPTRSSGGVTVGAPGDKGGG